MSDLPTGSDGESSSCSSSRITLELTGWWSKDTSTVVCVGDASVADAVLSSCIATQNTVLSITELSNGTKRACRVGGCEAEGARISWESKGGDCGSKNQRCVCVLHCERIKKKNLKEEKVLM